MKAIDDPEVIEFMKQVQFNIDELEKDYGHAAAEDMAEYFRWKMNKEKRGAI